MSESSSQGSNSSGFTLIIGNKNVSSWSLRGYLAVKHAGIEFDEVLISLRPDQDREKLDAMTPAGKVPTLKHSDKYIWDSLAICEYLSDLYPDKNYWPDDIDARAHARCVSAEMHSGFVALRSQMPMAIHNKLDSPMIEGDLERDIERVKTIWSECLDRYGETGPYLFGSYSVADMMYAPVVFRLRGYDVQLPEKLQEYCETITNHPDVKEWMDDSDPADLP